MMGYLGRYLGFNDWTRTWIHTADKNTEDSYKSF